MKPTIKILIFSFFLMMTGNAVMAKPLNLEAGGNIGLGTSMPYGTVIVPLKHEAGVAGKSTLAVQAFGLWYFKKDMAAQLILGFNRTRLGVDYTGTVHNKQYTYGLSFLEFGGGVTGLYDISNRISLFYEGGLLYLSPVSDISLSVDKEDQTLDDSYSAGSDINLYGGGGIQVLIPETDNKAYLRAGLRLKAGVLPVIEGKTNLSYTDEKDKLRHISAMFMLGVSYKL